MSYCRFGPDSDLYLWRGTDGKIVCSWCSLCPDDEWWEGSPEEAVTHVRLHLMAGLKVPDDVLERFNKDQI